MSQEFQWPPRHHTKLEQKVTDLMADVAKLNEAIAGLTSSVDSAVAEIAELKAKVAEGATSTPTQAEVDAQAQSIEADAAKLMAAKSA